MEKHIEEKKGFERVQHPNRLLCSPRLFLTTNSYELYKIKYTKVRISCKLLAWINLP